MKAIAGIFIFLCFDTQPYGLQAFRTKPEMIVLGSSADKATTTRNFPVGAYTKTTSTTVQVISGVKKTHVVYTKHTMMALSDDKTILETETNSNGSISKQQMEIPLHSDVPPKEITSPPAGSASGSESLMVGNTSVSCKWVELKRVAPGGQLVMRTWYSTEVPGYIVRTVVHFVGAGLTTDTTVEVTEFKRN